MRTFHILLAILFPLITTAQSIESISPVSSIQGESIILSITGKNTSFTLGTNTVKLVLTSNSSINIKATSVSCINDTLLRASFTLNTNSMTGQYDVIIDNSAASNLYKLVNAFTINTNGTAILSITPSSAKQGDTVELIIKSFNTHNIQAGSCKVKLQTAALVINPFTTSIIDDVTVKCKFAFTYSDYPTTYNVIFTNPVIKSVQLNSAFKLIKGPFSPELISVSPKSANKIDSVLLTIMGKNTFFLKDSNSFYLHSSSGASIYPKKINYINDTLITAFFVFPNSFYIGKYDLISISNLLKLSDAFTLNDPLIKPIVLSFDPVYSKQGDSVLLTIKGRNTHFQSGNASVYLINFWWIDAKSVDVINDSLIRAKFSFPYIHEPVKYKFTVYDHLDGALVAKDSFSLNKGDKVPLIKNITPNNTEQGHDRSILFECNKDFLPVFNLSYIDLNRNNVIYRSMSFTILDDSTFKAAFQFPIDTAAVGIYDINLYNHHYKKLSLPAGFTINKSLTPPMIISVTPSTATQFDTVLVTIKGDKTHFLLGKFDVYMQPPNNANFNIKPKERIILNDTTLLVKFILNANYYPSILYDVIIKDEFDGMIVKNSGFTVNRIYVQEPKIIDITPKSAAQGELVTLSIIGTKQSFVPGLMEVRLVLTSNPAITISASSVTYINDSLVSADFSFQNGETSGTYFVTINNRILLSYYHFYIEPTSLSLLSINPAWANQTDTVMLQVTGLKTHFSGADSVWLKSRYGVNLKPFLINAINDTLTTVHFAFNKSNLPGIYSIHLKSKVDNVIMSLANVFTLTGTINNTALIDVTPTYSGCYFGSTFKTKFTIYAKGTHFLSEIDTVVFHNTQFVQQVIYPSEIEIVNDTVITASVNFMNSCGIYDVVVIGKENYILSGKIHVTPPVLVHELIPKEVLKIFPNPSEGGFTIEVSEDLEKGSLSVLDIFGKVITSLDQIEESTNIDLSSLASGIYFVKLIKGNTCKTQKIIKR